MKRALILQGGTMRGAFIVGVMSEIYQRLGLNYFDAIYSSSVGIFEQVFFAANQPSVMENTWREYVTGRQLINVFNIFNGREVLDLDYLVDLFQSKESWLDLNALNSFTHELFTFVADGETKKPVILDLKKINVFDAMKAACALPLMYKKKVTIKGKRYLDYHVSKNIEFKAFIAGEMKQYDEVLAVITYPKDSRIMFKNIIFPSKMPLWSSFDTNKARITKTIEQGRIDAAAFFEASQLLNKKPYETVEIHS